MKKTSIFVMIFMMVLLGGCGDFNEETITDFMRELREMQATVSEEPQEEQQNVSQETEPSLQIGSTILEDEDFVFACGYNTIIRIDKVNNKSTLLWEKNEKSKFMSGKAVLSGDYIYFVEGCGSENQYGVKFSMVTKDGTGYMSFYEMPAYDCYSLLLQEGKLYAKCGNIMKAFELDENGIPKEINPESISAIAFMPVGYTEITCYNDSTCVLTAVESLEYYGYMLLYDADWNMVQYLPETDEIKEVTTVPSGSLHIWNETYILFYNYQESQLYLTDAKTLEVCQTIDIDSGMSAFDMDDQYVYIGKTQEDGTYLYSAISIETGEISELFIQEKSETAQAYLASDSLMNLSVRNGFIYYPVFADYNIYVARRELADMSHEEIFKEAYYNSGISEVGQKETYSNVIKDEATDTVIAEITLDTLVVDQRFEGADEINRILAEEKESFIQMTDTDLEWVFEDMETYPDTFIAYSYSGVLSEISYYDGNYLSFMEDKYLFTGGAHGMPYWSAHTFDLHTGQELLLTDVISNSEEELKDIVVAAFDSYISKDPDAYWEDALVTVREYTSYNSQYFLTDDGILFWFGPYDLSSYAAGFQRVTIPYSEFQMNIQLKP